MSRKPVMIWALSFLLLATSVQPASAVCFEFVGFPIFQCNDLAYFAPTTANGVQVPITFDPNGRPTNVSTVFWQIGFGNDTLNTGGGTSGTGMAASSFNGNDSGLAFVDIQEGHFVHPGLPVNSLCVRSNNWGNTGIDGCCDNPRTTSLPMSDDDILNPYYDVYAAENGYRGRYSLDWQQDFPIAVLLTESSGRYFAVAAVATLDRGNTGDQSDQDCSQWPSIPNPATCDFREGYYNFKDIADGLLNVMTSRPNVVPWQETPQPIVTNLTPVNPSDPSSDLTVDVAWNAAIVYSDLSVRPSTNPAMAPADGNFPAGVGVSDIEAYSPLVRYIVEVALRTDPGFSSPLSSIETTDTSLTGFPVPFGDCLRVRTLFGKRPEVTVPSLAECRVGRCGDIGYEVVSMRSCPELVCSPSPEVCDGLDNDCDGVVDNEVPGDGDPCSTGLPGVCADGIQRCNAGAFTCEAPAASPEVCDGLDNDCDGVADEGIHPYSNGDPDGDSICSIGDNCPGEYNPTQYDRDSDGDGDACDLTIVAPPEWSAVDCRQGANPPTISWLPYVYDRFRVSISTDPAVLSFLSRRSLRGTSWQPRRNIWRDVCDAGGSLFYIRVAGEDIDVPNNDPNRVALSEAVVVTVLR